MATTTKAANLYETLAAGAVPVSAVLESVPQTALAVAWASQEVEFGHRKFCVTGPAGRNPDASALIVEQADGEPSEWSGPKTPAHAPLNGVLKHGVPKGVGRFFKYVPAVDPVTGSESLDREAISAEQAAELLALHVRLTDKGYAKLQPAAT